MHCLSVIWLVLLLLQCLVLHTVSLPKVVPATGRENENTSDDLKKDSYYKELRMPQVYPTMEDSYLCSSFKITEPTEYITHFEPLATADRAHHMLIYGCDVPYNKNPGEYWKCGRLCQTSPKILYAWAKNAPPTTLPSDVGFQIGQNTDIKYLVLQIHYTKPVPEREDGDTSGTRLTLTKSKQKFIAGIYLLLKYSLNIPPNVKNIHGDISCRYDGDSPLYPFAFRVHAHTLSTVISGYHFNGSIHQLGKGNPQWPQAFYPMDQPHIIKKGDYLAARCTYDSTEQEGYTQIGGRHSDEMCNFYMMYYTNSTTGLPFYECGGDNFKWLTRDLPADSDVPLPPNPALEMVAHAHAPQHLQGVETLEDWALDSSVQLGQVGGLATDSAGNLHVFHRGPRVWERMIFSTQNQFNNVDAGPITQSTLLTFSPDGKLLKKTGENLFYLPHGLHIDKDDNLWLTDVAMHQVFKIEKGNNNPSIILGQKFEPGSDVKHFCKPADVATEVTGEFYVADGYCNHRIMKFDADGSFLSQWGTQSVNVGVDGFPPPGALDIPHSVVTVEDLGWVCVADRENGRIQCFNQQGTFVKQIHPPEFHGRLFALDYSKTNKLLYAVNGPDVYGRNYPVSGFVIDPQSGALLETFSPPGGFHRPHCIAVSPDGLLAYVGQIDTTDPHKLWKFQLNPQPSVTPHQEDNKISKGPILPDNSHASVKKAGVLVHPGTSDMGSVEMEETMIKAKSGDTSDLGVSLVIGALLVVPIAIIVVVTVIMRMKRRARMREYREDALVTVKEFVVYED